MLPLKRNEKLTTPITIRFGEDFQKAKKEAETKLRLDFAEWARITLERELKSLLNK